jgi:hypothetical protein
MNENETRPRRADTALGSDEEILAGIRHKLAGVEGSVPLPPPWNPTGRAASTARPLVRSGFRLAVAPLVVIAAVIVVALGAGLVGRGPIAAPAATSPGAAVFIDYQGFGSQTVTAAQIESEVQILDQRLTDAGISARVSAATPSGGIPAESAAIRVALYDQAATARAEALIGQVGLLQFVLLPPAQYGTSIKTGPKAVPSPGDAIDPSLPAQFDSSSLDPASISAKVSVESADSWEVDFAFKQDVAPTFADWTAAHVNDYFAIVLDGKVLSAPFIYSRVDGGQGRITGVTQAQAEDLAAFLKSQPLPFALQEVGKSLPSGTRASSPASLPGETPGVSVNPAPSQETPTSTSTPTPKYSPIPVPSDVHLPSRGPILPEIPKPTNAP